MTAGIIEAASTGKLCRELTGFGINHEEALEVESKLIYRIWPHSKKGSLVNICNFLSNFFRNPVTPRHADLASSLISHFSLGMMARDKGIFGAVFGSIRAQKQSLRFQEVEHNMRVRMQTFAHAR
ncbi:MAG: hypothetical protein JWR60_3669 [Polaromonas sp.]|nr:hypothetical protein [Polaromonas sp.]